MTENYNVKMFDGLHASVVKVTEYYFVSQNFDVPFVGSHDLIGMDLKKVIASRVTILLSDKKVKCSEHFKRFVQTW